MQDEEESAEIQQCSGELLYTYHTDDKETKERRGTSVYMILDISGINVASVQEKKRPMMLKKRKNKTGQRSE